jgi:hypothetical protein
LTLISPETVLRLSTVEGRSMRRIDEKIRRIDQARIILGHLLQNPGKAVETPHGFYTLEDNKLVFVPRKPARSPHKSKAQFTVVIPSFGAKLAYN